MESESGLMGFEGVLMLIGMCDMKEERIRRSVGREEAYKATDSLREIVAGACEPSSCHCRGDYQGLAWRHFPTSSREYKPRWWGTYCRATTIFPD